jgi:hypothetical protein
MDDDQVVAVVVSVIGTVVPTSTPVSVGASSSSSSSPHAAKAVTAKAAHAMVANGFKRMLFGSFHAARCPYGTQVGVTEPTHMLPL